MSVSFTTATGTAAEGDGATDVQVTLHTTLPVLIEDLVFEVADLGSGTATSGTDYATFATQQLTFPTGSVDGAVLMVSFDPLDDSLVEGLDESLRLRLQSPTGGALAGPTTFTATITDINAAALAFAAGTAATGDEATGPEAIAIELDCGAGVTLGTAVSIRVSDTGTGTASSSADYAPFATSTVSFPVGSADGAIQTVSVQVMDDGFVEGDETVVLNLSNPAGCTIGALFAHVLTIEDDDIGGPSSFAAAEGATGTENSLIYDELVALGSQTVGAGPNAGTLLRVSNVGGASMALATPNLTGTNQNDFAVDLETSSFGFAPSTAGLMASEQHSPLIALQPDGGPGVVMAIDAARLASMRAEEELVLRNFEIPDLGPVTLQLRRRPLPLTPDARLMIDGEEIAGGIRTLLGDLQLWSGTIAGMEGSRVFLVLNGQSIDGFIELPFPGDRVHFMAEGPGRARLVRAPELQSLGLQPPTDFCAGALFAPGQAPQRLEHNPDEPTTTALTLTNARLALETDYQFFQKFGSSAGLTNYVTGLIGAISDQYTTDVQTTLSIASLGIHTTSNDGWTTQESSAPNPRTGALLNEFRAAWGTGWAGNADLAHFLSGADLGGGVAYVGQLCSPSFGFAVSANLNGNINWGTWTGASSGFTWDFVVVAHELGHNFGTGHTHDYCPPLDHCYTNCDMTTSCPRGTIMSYCHLCGGMGNVDLRFHPVAADFMRFRINLSCLGDASLAPGDFVQYRLRFNPLTDTGARSAELEFEHNALNVTQPFRVQLSGTAN